MGRAALFLAAFLVVCGATVVFPGIDLAASALFHDPARGFFLADFAPIRFLRAAIPYLAVAIALAGLGLIAVSARGRWRGLDWRAGAFLLLALAVGPGLVVNVVFKDHWGRARPAQVASFGGEARFSPAFVPSDQCARNCSFPAGDPAVGFVLVGAGFLAVTPWRRRSIIGAALGLGAVIGLARMAQGGHFLSDVIASGFLVCATTWLLHRWIVLHDGLGALVRDLAHPPPALRRFLLLLVAAAAAVAASFAWLDRPLAVYFSRPDPALRGIFRVVTTFGESTGYLVVAALVAVVLGTVARRTADEARQRKLALNAWRAAFVFVAVAGAGLAGDILKPVFGRARPRLFISDGIYGFTWHGAHASHWSFPSGHAITIVALAAALVVIERRLLPYCVAAALLVMASRIVLDQHYLSDVLAGAALAGAAVWAVRAAFRRALSDNP
ncbi:MAG TPA: phosphatase PAP2 family protein [Stellaceae bacterium]|nr:phosphatase PAP2 family protein [Stellaceae bacterium]